jgi:hypothetical protein
VQHEKDKEMLTEPVYAVAQAERRDFEEQARREQESMVGWKLGPLFDPAGFADRFQRLTMEAAIEMGTAGAEAMLEPGSSYGRYSALYMLKVSNEGLIERHPELLKRRDDFRSFLLAGPVPALRLPALLRAALSVTRGRRPRPSDVYDVLHVTRSLSRCDIVTSDGGMVQLCRNYGSSPRASSCTRPGNSTSSRQGSHGRNSRHALTAGRTGLLAHLSKRFPQGSSPVYLEWPRETEKAPFPGPFCVGGAGIEPATSCV